MYQPMLFIHWKQTRLVLVPFVIAAFGLPLMVVQGLGALRGTGEASMEAYRIVTEFEVWLPFFPALAAAIGLTLALSAWNWDHQLNHVYALSLPLARWEYAMLKMGAGVVLALIPATAMWLGAHLASASVTLPEGLHAYPNQLGLRFFLAILMSYALLFAMAAGTTKTTVWIVSSVIAFFIVGDLLNGALAFYFPFFESFNMVEATANWLIRAGGPFEVFTGNWTLIDV